MQTVIRSVKNNASLTRFVGIKRKEKKRKKKLIEKEKNLKYIIAWAGWMLRARGSAARDGGEYLRPEAE